MEEGIMEFTIETLSEREEDIQSTTDETVARYQKKLSLQEATVWKTDAMAL